MKRIIVVVGTRPNFMKVTRLKQVAQRSGGIDFELVHTGQHADGRMSTVFFEQFGLTPDRLLSVPEGSPAARLGHLMLALEPVMRERRPDAVMVVGDVDSTLAGALAANKLGLPIVHLESGLRSGDMGMPEEVNRILTDRISWLCLITEPSGHTNLLREGTAEDRIVMVGNTMIDTLVAFDAEIARSPVMHELGLSEGGHALITMHRPDNVDHEEPLNRLVGLIALVAAWRQVVFPVHPRTARNLERFGLLGRLRAMPGVVLCEPLDYFRFQRLIATSAFVITDSGGIQEETTFRRIPCLTLRPSTERPVTITEGTNELITFDLDALAGALERIEGGTFKKGRIPSLWDGHATERVVEAIKHAL
ncbi:MAG: UDP-N-acetylglucosamine 2-epimerase (non-hydrolyzing) [Flavobacteriales bacterium]|jgi:UDP-N-acetylglucosamine 2-epimerase (non-hydrolysing)|nr:MAG: UDP-N-acetylglucosamine 2-epimerase (non-hydrolyzing) [Flavobacteriales bacterium]